MTQDELKKEIEMDFWNQIISWETDPFKFVKMNPKFMICSREYHEKQRLKIEKLGQMITKLNEKLKNLSHHEPNQTRTAPRPKRRYL